MNQSLAKMLRRAIPNMPRKQYQALKRAIVKHGTTAKLRAALRAQFQKAINSNKANSFRSDRQIPSALNRFVVGAS